MTQPTSIYPPTTDTPGWAPPGWAPPGGSSWGQTPPPAPPAPRRSHGGWIFLGVAVAVGILATAGFMVGAKTNTNTVASTTTATGSIGTAVGPVTMVAWASRYGSPDAETLVADLHAISSDASSMDVSGLASTCRAFQRHLATATAHLPTPNASLTVELETSYGYFDQAATACISGATNLDTAAITRMGTYITLGTASITRATAIVESLN